MPSRADPSTTSRTESMPARWPSTRGRGRCAARGRLPSMMTATWAGRRSKLTCRASASSAEPGVTEARTSSRLMGLHAHHNKSVLDLHQEEAPGRGRPAGKRAVRRRQQPGDAVHGPLAPADLDYRPDQAPHHVAEKPLPVDLEDQRLLAIAPPGRARDLAHGGVVRAPGAPKRGAIVLAGNGPRRVLHQGQGQR